MESGAEAKPVARLEPLVLGIRGSCYRPTISPQVASATSAGAQREVLNGSGQQKDFCALGAKGLREDLVQGRCKGRSAASSPLLSAGKES